MSPSDSSPILPPSKSPPDVKIRALFSFVFSLSVIVTVVAKVAVAAFPVVLPELHDTLPVTFPVNAPTKAVDVTLVAPVTTPASTLIVPSKTIADPAAGVRFNAPDVAEIVFVLTLRLSTCKAVRVPREVILA